MIGQPIVTVSADRNGNPWVGPLNPNPELTVDATGWALTQYNSVNLLPVWQGGGIYFPAQPANGNLLVSQAARNAVGVDAPSPPGVTYRIRATVRVESLPVTIVAQVVASATTTDLQQTTNLATVTYSAAGTYVIDVSGTLPPAADALPYRFVRLSKQSPNGQPTGAIWLDRLDLSWFNSAAVPVDITCLIDSVSIRHGRDDTTSQPDASTTTLDCSWQASVQALPDVVEIGAGLFVDLEYPAGSGTLYRRFAGRVTDVNLAWEDAGPETPERPAAQIIAAGYSADLGNRIVGDQPFPQELDGARVQRVLSLAGITVSGATSDPGTVQVLPRDIDSQPALEVARATAESAGGMVWESRNGDVRYADAEHRRGAGVALHLDSCDLLVSPTWVRTKDGLVNSVSIGYGVAPEGGEQPRYVNARQDSIDRFGTYALSKTTELAALADATAMGSLLLTRNITPVWVLAELPLAVRDLDDERTATLLGLDLHDLIQVTGLPSAGSAPTTANLWIEGWTETFAWGEHELTIGVSGYCRTAPPPRWDDVNPDWTWDTVSPPDLIWDDAACFGPPVNRGRWNDVPASLRWNSVAPTVTWDTWDTAQTTGA